MPRLALSVLAAAAAVPFVELAWFWDRLPPRVAIHFGFSGRPDNWASPTFYAAVMGSVILLQAAIFGGMPWLVDWLVRRAPRAINLPADIKERVVQDPAARASLVRLFARFALVTGLAVLALLASANHGVIAANLEQPARLESAWVYPALGVTLAVTFCATAWLIVAARRI